MNLFNGISKGVFIVAALMALVILFLLSMMARLYRKAGPHEALVVYGFRGTRVVKGHGTVIFPMVEASRQLSLELMSFDVAPTQDLYTKQGVAVTVEAVAQIKVKSDLESIQTAAEQFLTKSPEQRESLIRLVMEGHLRGIIGQLTVEQIAKEPGTGRPGGGARPPSPRPRPIRSVCWRRRCRRPSRPRRSAISTSRKRTTSRP